MVSVEYWNSVGVPAEEIVSNIKNERKSYKAIMRAYDKETRKIIAQFLNVPLTSNDDEQNLEAMSLSRKFPEYICLERFSMNKKALLHEFSCKPKFSQLFEGGDYREPILKIIKLFQEDKDNLITLLLFCEFYEKSSHKRYYIDKSWDENLSRTFKTSFRGLKNRVSRRFKKKFELIRDFNDGESDYFIFHRAKKEAVQEVFGLKNISYIPKSDLFIKINKSDNTLEIRCYDSRLISLLLKFLKQKLGLTLIRADPLEENYGKARAQIKHVLFETHANPPVAFHVDQIEFYQAGDIPKVQMTVGKKNSTDDVKATVIKLGEQGFVDINDIENIKSFDITIAGRSHLIKLEKEGNSMYLRYEGNDRETFETTVKRLGLAVNTIFFPEPSDEERKQDFQKLLHYKGKPALREYQKELLEKMKERGIVQLTSESLWICKDNPKHRYTQEYERCPVCQARMEKKSEYSGSTIDMDGVNKYVKDLLETTFGGDNIFDGERTTYGKTYRLHRIQKGKFNFYVYIDDKSDIARVCKQFKRSLMPFIVITHQQRPKGFIEESLFPVVSLSELFLGQNGNILNTEAGHLEETFFARLEEAAREANHNTSQVVDGSARNYTKDNLEDDVFNIMKYTFKVGEKWGRETSQNNTRS